MPDKNNTPLTGYPSIDKPWLKYYSQEAIYAPTPEKSIYEYMWENNKDYPEDIAINYLGRKITYGELFNSIEKTAKAFAALGVVPGEIVTVALPSIPEALYIVYALNRLGAVANMIHPIAGMQEIINYINEVGSSIVVLFDNTYELIKDSLEEISVQFAIVVSVSHSLPTVKKVLYRLKQKQKPILHNSKILLWNQFLNGGQEDPVPHIEKNTREMALISHTGGTTGEPKGVMLSDYNIVSVIWQISQEMVFERQEINMAVLPPFVSYSLVDGMLAPLTYGFQLVLIPQYNPAAFHQYVKKYRFNHLMASIPAYYEPLLNNKKLRSMDLSCIRHIYYGGEKMDAKMEELINDFLMSRGAKFPLAKGLGSTEMTSAATVTYEGINLKDSSGIPLVKVVCKIVVPDSMEELPYDTPGEICMTGPSLMIGYYNKIEETSSVIKCHADGLRWLHTGDLGYINTDGAVFVTGRIKRIIMTRGIDGNPTKMFPDRIEKAIYGNPKVKVCCVVGIPDAERVNYPKAFVVLKEGVEENELTRESILNTCKAALPDYMVPEEIEFRTDLPRTARGKVDYRKLEESCR